MPVRLPRVELPHWIAQPRPERPVCGPGVVFFAGVLIPILLATYGFNCILSGEAVIVGYAGLFDLHDIDAAICGVGTVALAVLLNCAAFWDQVKDSTRASARIKILCLALIGACSYTLCFRMLPGLWQ